MSLWVLGEAVMRGVFGLIIWTMMAGSILPAMGFKAEERPQAVCEALEGAGAHRGALIRVYDELAPEQYAGLDFLIANMPGRDLKALDAGLLASNIRLAYAAREAAPWGGTIPDEIFLNDVLPYAQLNERRDAWRERFFEELRPLIADCSLPGEAAVALNTQMFKKLDVVYSKARPKPGQSPLESIAANKASCTGLSILLADACRALGVPARIAGTPQWSETGGNHTWVEVWDGGRWHCLGAAESDQLDKTWFSARAASQDGENPAQKIYAASFKKTDLYFPLVWALEIRDVPAVDVTEHYAQSQARAPELETLLKLVDSGPLAGLCADPATAKLSVAPGAIAMLRRALWGRYVEEIRNDPKRRREHGQSCVCYGGAVMRYAAFKNGEKPEAGWPLYIAMHGGGGAPAPLNDSQWEQMKKYYRSSVKNGIYLAPRGVNNEWNLHWTPESFVCYERIVANMIAFEGVDPNRVYIMGYSAGGDAVYQIPARLPGLWAAAAMSAGHPNDAPPVNDAVVPFLIQVGELDGGYGRNEVAAAYGAQLDALEAQHPGLYVHDCFIHKGRAHNIIDRDPAGRPQTVYASPAEWLKRRGEAKTVDIDTNSVHWLSRRERNPLGGAVIWDPAVTPESCKAPEPDFWPLPGRGPGCLWLSLDRYKGVAPLAPGRIEAVHTPGTNDIAMAMEGNYVKLLLNETQFDLTRPVRVTVDGRTLECQPEPRLRTMLQTLLDRGDPAAIFPAALTLTKNPEGDWMLEPAND